MRVKKSTILKFSLFFLIAFLIPLAYLFNERAILGYIYKHNNQPENVAVTNLSPESFTISWFTDRADVGYVAVLPNDDGDVTKLEKFDKNYTYTLYKDDRAVLESKTKTDLEPYDIITPEGYEDEMVYFSNVVNSNSLADDPELFTHHITVSGLDAETEYAIVIFNGATFYPVDISTVKTPYALNYDEYLISTQEDKKPQSLYDRLAKKEKLSPVFTLKTLQQTDTLTTPVPLYGVMQGRIIDNGLPTTLQETEYADVRDGIVYMYDEESRNYFSAPVRSGSNWFADLDSTQLTGDMLNVYGQINSLQPAFVEKLKYADLMGEKYEVKVDIEMETSERGERGVTDESSKAGVDGESDNIAQIYRNSQYNFALNQEPTMLPNLGENSSWILDALVGDVSAASINCRQDLPDQTVPGAKSKDEYGKLMDMWTNNKGKNYARECYNDVVCRSNAAGINPAWSLTIWANESAASNYTFTAAKVADFGIIYKPRQDFNAQIETFLTFTYKKECAELDFWTSWATKYLTGTCDADKVEPISGFTGKTYLKSIQDKWKLVSSAGFPDSPKITPKTSGCTSDDGGTPPLPEDPGDLPKPPAGLPDNKWLPITGVYGDGTLVSPEVDRACNQAKTCTCVWKYNIKPGEYTKVALYGQTCKVNGDIVKTPGDVNPPVETKGYEVTFYDNLSLVSFPFQPVNSAKKDLKASDFLVKYANADGNYISQISQFKSGKWETYSYDFVEKISVGTDFVIKPGKGYFVRAGKTAPEEFMVTLQGKPLSTKPEIKLVEGWNLIGLGERENITANSFMKVNKADGASYWDTAAGFFKGVMKSGGKLYGKEFQLKSYNGYFVLKLPEVGINEDEERSAAPETPTTPGVITTNFTGERVLAKPGPKCCGVTRNNENRIFLDWEDEITACYSTFPGGKVGGGYVILYTTEVPGISKSACVKMTDAVCCDFNGTKGWVAEASCPSGKAIGGVGKEECR